MNHKKWTPAIGDRVTLSGVILKIDADDQKLPYQIKFDGHMRDLPGAWISEAQLRKSPVPPRTPTLLEAAQALGGMPEGYCFCSKNRIGDDSKVHEPECADLRAAIAKAAG